VGESSIWVSRVTGECAAPEREGVVCGAGRLVSGRGDSTFSYTQVAVRAGETSVAPAGYSILSGDPQTVRGAAAELAPTVHGLTAAPPAEPDVPWEELPWAFMATAEAVATTEEGDAERPNHWASMDRPWNRNMAAEGQGPEEVRTRLPARVTICACLGGLCSELEGWLRASLHFGKVLYVDAAGRPDALRRLRFGTCRCCTPTSCYQRP
jgi:hypothetical protein